MNLKNRFIGTLAAMAMALASRTYAQTSEVEKLFHELELRAASGITNIDEADPVLERFAKDSREAVAGALPLILKETSNPHSSVRGIAALALWEITTRPDGQTLLSTENPTFTALLVDPDIPIRRITGLAINNLHLDANSPLVPVLEAYLAREDAVSTIGAGVAGLLMQAAPSKADSTSAVVQFMRRQDQTSKSRNDMLQSVQVAGSKNRDIGKEVAAYAGDPDDQTSIHAIVTLQRMGTDVVLDNRQSLSQIASDKSRTQTVRAGAAKALSAIP